jgi:carboxypeptidase PM20D1
MLVHQILFKGLLLCFSVTSFAQLSEGCHSFLVHSKVARICLPGSSLNKYIDESPTAAAGLLSRFIQIPSISGKEQEAAVFLMEEGQLSGLHGKWLHGPSGEPNLILSLFPLEEGRPNFIFIHHLDVVEGMENAGWRYPPFSGALAEGYIWGRGAYDNKGPCISTLKSLEQLVGEASEGQWAFNVSLLALAGEEVFSEGGASFVAEKYMDLLKPHAFFGEGPLGLTGITRKKANMPIFSIALTSKSVLWLQLEIDYNANGHGSMPPNSYPTRDLILALDRLFKQKSKIVFTPLNKNILKLLGDQEGGIKGAFMKNMHIMKPLAVPIIRKDPLVSSFFTNTFSITYLSASNNGSNSLPTRAEAILDCRLLPNTDKDEFLKWINKSLRDDRIRINVLRETPSAMPTIDTGIIYTNITSTIRQFYPKSPIRSVLLPATNDSNFFRAKGYPVFCFVPFVMDANLLSYVHSANERLPYQVLEEGIKLQTQLIRNLIHSTP